MKLLENFYFNFPDNTKKFYYIRRLNRFISEVEDANKNRFLVHSPNTGSMKGLLSEGNECLCYDTENPARKYPLSFIAIKSGSIWCGIDTIKANSIAVDLIKSGLLPELSSMEEIKREVRTGNSRIDIHGKISGTEIFIEVKNVTLVENSVALFPDAPSTRAVKHLKELIKLRESGHISAMLFLIQRQDAEKFTGAASIHPEYAKMLQHAFSAGIKIYPVVMKCSERGLKFFKIIDYF
ncbi:MAG: DNA/RNA nuclease SfsA [Deltaproteobacteria bacterium]|nr:DNA/RNA nuclease SfsA [Deltaproteobacteria bacterium]